MNQKCSVVAIIGAPNAGKSTIINHLVGTKVSIVSPKVQTTRTRVRGIALFDETQLVLVDTPGIFAPKRRLDRAMVAAAWGGASDADIVCLLVDAAKGISSEVRNILDKLEHYGQKVHLVLNKVDLIKKEKLFALIQQLTSRGVFAEVFMVSALSGDGVDDFAKFLVSQAKEGPWLFPEDQVSDMPERILAAEITREKIFLQLHKELPYGMSVVNDKWEDKPDGSVRIEQTILVEREAHKRIVVGEKGSRIKAIGQAARKELEDLLDCKVHLFLFVKVSEKWGDDRSLYAEWNLDFNV